MNMKHAIIGINSKCAERIRSYMRVSNIHQIFNVSLKHPHIDFRRGLFLSLGLGFIVRLIPEILSYPYPIGFDTIYYAARINTGVVWYHWTSVFSTWLLYAILIPVHQVVRIDPFLLLKLAAPTLYALNSCGVYYFSRKALGWDVRWSLFGTFFFVFQLALLNLSWHSYRNMLGLAILLFTLPLLKNAKTKRGYAWLASLSILVVFSHEWSSVVMLGVILWAMVSDFLNGEKMRMLKVLAAITPALVIFLTSVYLVLFPVPVPVETNVIDAHDIILPSPGKVFFLVDYLGILSPIEYYPTYFDLVSRVMTLFCLLYLLCLPLVLVGFFRDKILNGWTVWLLVGSFNSVITPFCALHLWFRWMFMLVYPFTFYAVNGIQKIWKSQGNGVAPSFKWMSWMKVSRRGVLGVLLSTVLLGTLFMTSPLFFGRYGIFSIPNMNTYFPSTMLHNTVPLQDVKSTIQTMEWLNEHMVDGSCVLLRDAFQRWSDLYLDKEHTVVLFMVDVEKALNVALEHGFDPIYLIWWNDNIGWYGGLIVPSYFKFIFSSERISVFKYCNSSYI